jgi:transposase
MSFGKIAAQVSRLDVVVSKSTVQTTCQREIDRVDNASKPRSGAPRVITEEERDMMFDIILHHDPYIKWRDLTRECETAHERSV